MTVLSTFLESPLNFLSNDIKTSTKFDTIRKKTVSKLELEEEQGERTVKHKITCKPTWSEKMTVLSTFLESSLNFLSNNLKKFYKNGF